MFCIMDKFNQFAIVNRCGGGGGGSSGGSNYNSGASFRERQYTDTMRNMGYQNTRSYPKNTLTPSQAKQARTRTANTARHVVTQGAAGGARGCVSCHNGGFDPYTK